MWREGETHTDFVGLSCEGDTCFLFTCVFLRICVCVLLCNCMHKCVWVCVCVLPSDLWGLSSSASSLSLLAWRMNGPLSALPQPLLLALSLKLPFFFSAPPPSLYLISPHALPLHAPCHPHFLLPRSILCSAHLVDLILISLVSWPRPSAAAAISSSSSADPRRALTKHWPLISSQGHFGCGASISKGAVSMVGPPPLSFGLVWGFSAWFAFFCGWCSKMWKLKSQTRWNYKTHKSSRRQKVRYLSIVVISSRVRLCWQAVQSNPCIRLCSSSFQILLEDPQGGSQAQMGYVIPPASPGSTQGLLPVGGAQGITIRAIQTASTVFFVTPTWSLKARNPALEQQVHFDFKVSGAWNYKWDTWSFTNHLVPGTTTPWTTMMMMQIRQITYGKATGGKFSAPEAQ